QKGSSDELPVSALHEPKRNKQRCDRKEVVEREVRLRLKGMADQIRSHEHEQQRWPQEERVDTAGQQAQDCANEAGEQEPVLKTDGDDVRSAHEMECRGLERGNERRI